MIRTTTHRDLRACLVNGLALSLGLSLYLSPWPLRTCRAAQISSTSKLNVKDLGNPLLLDQNGQVIPLTTTQQSGSSGTNAGVVPSYVAYPVDAGKALPRGFPTVISDPATSGQTGTGPLHLDASIENRLNQTLTKAGEAAVYTGQGTYVVKPLSSLLGATGSGGGAILDWIASQRSTGSLSTTTTAVAPVEAQTLLPASLTDPITNSKLVKDMEHLFDIKSGKLVNWNQQSLNALESDLGIHPPKNVTTKTQASTSKPVLEAQVINSSGSGGTPQPAPVPEPGTLVIFSLVAAALAVRQIRTRRCRADQDRFTLSDRSRVQI